ncbi:MAG: hypothetical protein QGF98_05820 [Candidatus Poseidoniia archaeon]|jgi:hypothetical protein|nr:hypothetical protein [Candidatus Poseidoniia archaeon]|tara:strand:- start:192 stop:356 length:165 start_codon:yes stop_codon:yes gene_type:complete
MNEKDKIYLENYRKHLEQYNLSDDEILELKKHLKAVISNIIDTIYEKQYDFKND